MTERRSIIWLKDLNDCDLPAEIQGNPGLKHLITYLRGISPQEVNAWKEEIRQSRLHDWEDEDDDDEEEVNRLAEKDNQHHDDDTIEA